jgi:hypothetical protein
METNQVISSIVSQERQARSALNAKWLELWNLYKTKPLRVQHDAGWHSKLNDGRVFEIIETVGAYFRNALFFSDYWVELESREPGLAEITPLASAYFRDSLNASNFYRELRVATTQLLLLGFSAMRVFWDDGLKFEALNALNLYIESSRRYDPKFSYVFREHLLNKAEFLEWVAAKWLNKLEAEDAEAAFAKLATTKPTSNLLSLQSPTTNFHEFVEIIEFYDPIEGSLYRCVDDKVLHEEDGLDYPPWHVAVLFETPEDAYGVSIIDSSLGLVLENNILMNRRLDNIAVSIDNMWLFVDDGVTDPASIKTEPGKVITVARPDAVLPLRPPANNFNITYNEAAVLDAKIDRNIGAGAMISANTYRSGERVTAQEIQAVKEAGGNRITDVYELFEKNFVLPLLHQAYAVLRQHTKSAQVVKRKSNKPGINDYFKILPSDLRKDFSVRITATQSLLNRDRKIKTMTDFLSIVASVPQFNNLVDWQAMFADLLLNFGFDDPTRYVLKQEPATNSPQPKPSSALEELNQELTNIGGPAYSLALKEAIAAGKLPDAIRSLIGVSPKQEQDQVQDNAIMAAMAAPQAE